MGRERGGECEYGRGRGDKQCMSKGRVVSEGRI